MKRLIVLVGFLVIAGVGGWVWYGSLKKKQEITPEQPQQVFHEANDVQAKQEVEPSSEWKTYRNEKFGFEFRYPNGFVVIPRNTPGLFIVLKESDYNQLKKKKNKSLTENPYLAVVDDQGTEAISIGLSRDYGVLSGVGTVEIDLKSSLLGCTNDICTETNLGTTYSNTLSFFEKIDSKSNQDVYRYTLTTKNLNTGETFNRIGDIGFIDGISFRAESLKVGNLTEDFMQALHLIVTTIKQL